MEEKKDESRLDLLPNVTAQMRIALGNIHLAAAAIAPAGAREQDPELDRRAAVLDQSYYQLLRLVSNLTAAGSLKADDPLPTRDRDLVALIREACERSVSLAAMLGIRLSFSCAEKAHVCAIHAASLEQLLFQLLSNALKFTPSGGSVTVELKFSGGRVLLSVTDTGCGISDERILTLFDRYDHKDLMDPPPHGLGLGLSLCKRIAEGHGGTIIAESRPGEGTRITCSLPDRRTGTFEVSDVSFDYCGGFNPTLLALSDALPTRAFLIRNED